MYHPASQSAAEFAAAGRGFDKEDYEFLELQNVSPSLTVNLRGVRFSAGIELTLGDLSVAPGERVVLVRNLAAFANRYGSGPRVAGVYGNETNPDLDGKLSNSGERIQLLDPLGGVVLDFAYQDFW